VTDTVDGNDNDIAVENVADGGRYYEKICSNLY